MKNKHQPFGRAVGSFQESGDVWVMDWQLEEYESVLYGEMFSGVSPAVVALKK